VKFIWLFVITLFAANVNVNARGTILKHKFEKKFPTDRVGGCGNSQIKDCDDLAEGDQDF
jgi:hypothetical protein